MRRGFGRTRELGETVLVRRPRSTQERLVVVRPRVLAQQALTGSLGRGTFPLEDRVLVRVAGVVAGRVGVPQVDEHVRHRLASVDVDDADVHELSGVRVVVSEQFPCKRKGPKKTHEGETELVLRHVLTDRVALGVVVRALGEHRGDCK